MLKGLGFTLQANAKTRKGGTHPDRDAHFAQIGKQAESFLADGQPVILVDTEKKENILCTAGHRMLDPNVRISRTWCSRG